MEMRQTSAWGAVVSFEIPDSNGQLAQLRYSRDDQKLEEISVDTELYRIEYNDNSEVVDVVLADSEDRRALRSGEQEGYLLPTWLSRDTLHGAYYDRIGCTDCNNAVSIACAGIDVACTICSFFCRVNPVLELVIDYACRGIGLTCNMQNVIGELNACDNLFCCDRSKCGILGVCYEEGTDKCCEDGSVVDAGSCCEEEVTESCCGLEHCGPGIPGGGVDPNCYNVGIEKCCEGAQPATIVAASDCCPYEVRVFGT